jgi:two-component system sensor histidine kinase KdpD
LRTPLTSIRAAATTLIESEGLDDASRLDMATIVDEEASRLDALIGEAVEMAEIDAQVIKVRPVAQRPAHPSRPGRGGVASCSGQASRHHRRRGNRISPPGSMPICWAASFAILLEKCGPLFAFRQPHHFARSPHQRAPSSFFVEDNGPGIDSVDLPLIFEKFYRGREGAASRKGSGMGLAIVRALLIAHGGGYRGLQHTQGRHQLPVSGCRWWKKNPASELAKTGKLTTSRSWKKSFDL